MKRLRSIRTFAACAIACAIASWGCEDAVPKDYEPQNFVEAFLLVDEPIQNIIIMRSQPPLDSFSYERALIRDAKVIVRGDGREFELVIDREGERGWLFPDTSYKVKPHTRYDIDITFADGSRAFASDTTPGRIDWVRRPPRMARYPLDSVNLKTPDSLYIEWTRNPDMPWYIISIACLDTLGYGKYLDPPTNEMNRRIYRPWSEDYQFRERSAMTFVLSTKVPVVWTFFRRYGLHSVTVYSPSYSYLRWFQQYATKAAYDPLLGNMKGSAIGAFTSAYALRDTFFILKNQP